MTTMRLEFAVLVQALLLCPGKTLLTPDESACAVPGGPCGIVRSTHPIEVPACRVPVRNLRDDTTRPGSAMPAEVHHVDDATAGDLSGGRDVCVRHEDIDDAPAEDRFEAAVVP